MSDSQMQKLQDKAEQVNLVLESVPSMEIGKNVIAGKVKDAIILKFKISLDNRLSLLSVLVSTYKKKPIEIYCVSGFSKIISKTATFEEAKTFLLEFVNVVREGNVDTALSNSIGRAAHIAFSQKFIEKTLSKWNSKNLDETYQVLEEEILKLTKAVSVSVEGDIEKVSSVHVRHKHPICELLKPVEPITPESGSKSSSPSTVKNELEEFLSLVESKYPQILNVKVVSDQTNGVYSDFLNENEIVFCKIPYESEENIKKADELKLTEPAQNLKELECKLIKQLSLDNEYHIFSEGPSGILFHAVETQPVKVKVLRKPDPNNQSHASSEKKNTYALPIAIGVGLLIVIVIGLLMVN
ncbi:MAG: hypothetical protein H7A24_15465 [Leptospiraceae bacterium]|nr:hypothetical protein [Leptospiraceae bacterium]MCP5513284.1 hypothetical protein [Leptospiraceae bacterium]